jgi:hypothetical protein
MPSSIPRLSLSTSGRPETSVVNTGNGRVELIRGMILHQRASGVQTLADGDRGHLPGVPGSQRTDDLLFFFSS